MKTHDLKKAAALSVAALLNIPALLLAQDATPAPSPSASPAPTAAVDSTPASTPATSPSGTPTDRMEQFRQKLNERLKTELKATDEEWTVILPLLEKVQTKMRDSSPFRGFGGLGRGGRGGGGFGGGPGGGGNNASPAPGQTPRPRGGTPETDALWTALDSENSSPTDIQTKLAALRDARKKSAAELEEARQDLTKVLTQRQEAVLVLIGILD